MSKDTKSTKGTKGTNDTGSQDTGSQNAGTTAPATAPARRGRKPGVTMTQAEKDQMAANRVKNLIEGAALSNPNTWQNVDPAKVKAIIEAATKGVESAKAALKAELQKKLAELEETPAAVDPAPAATNG
jgi:hypothetical protein